MGACSMSSWYVYLLLCKDGSLYTGITTDVARRMAQHQSGTGSAYVRSKGFQQLLAFQVCTSRSDALHKEYQIKQLPKEEKRKWFSN